MDIMNIVENVIDKYLIHRDCILWSLSIVFLLVTLIEMIKFEEHKRYAINKCLHSIFYASASICIGKLFYLFELVPEVLEKYKYFNIVFFMILSGLIIVYGLIQAGMYKKIVIPMTQICKYIPYVIYLELFLLTVTYHLEWIELIVGILTIICCELVPRLLEKATYKEANIVSKEYDYPNPDLYYPREKQLESFVEILKQQKNEPYAIMISGEWGIGKSSFMLAVEKKLKEDKFIWVKAGSEKTVSEIMLEISEQILNVLKENNILIEKDGIIEKYFLAFSGLLDETGLSFFNKFADIFGMNQISDSEDYIKNKLEELDKTIYLIVDDLDRCDEDYQLKMFKVIRESTELPHCKTIFLVDKKKFLINEYDENHIEKYVSYTLDLCEVGYEDIVSSFFDEIIKEEFIRTINPVLSKNRNSEDIKKLIYNFPHDALEKCSSTMTKLEDSIKHKKEDEIQSETKRIKDLARTMSNIEKNITNSRKIKNYLKGVRRTIFNLNNGIEECSQEFQNEDWLKAVVEVQFVKYILPETFAEIKNCRDISEFGNNYEGCGIEYILGMKYGFLLLEERKEKLLNEIIYKVDVIDFLTVKTEREKYLDELYSNKATIKHANEYVGYAKTYDDFNKILELCDNQSFNNYSDRESFVKVILSAMSGQISSLRSEKKQFFDFSKKLVDFLSKLNLSEREQNICNYEGRMIIRRILVENSHFLRDIVSILFEMNQVESNWKSLSVSDVDEFYTVLKRIDNNTLYKGLEEESNKLLGIKKYYSNLVTELQKEDYKEVGLDLEKTQEKLNIIFDTCLLWRNVEPTFEDGQDEELLLFKQYFSLEDYSVYALATENVREVKQAIEVLKMFYESKIDDYNSDYSQLLLRLSHHIVLIYEGNPTWFEGREEEISSLLSETAEKCYMLDKLEGNYAEEVIEKIKIYLYKFGRYCRDIQRNSEDDGDEQYTDEEDIKE